MTVVELLKDRYPVLIGSCGPQYTLSALPSQAQLSYSTPTESSDGTSKLNTNSQSNHPSNASVHTRLLCFKTKMCHFNLHNKCSRGQFCAFAHTNEELQDKPNFMKTKLCSKWQIGQCSNNAGTCLYAHGLDDLRNFRGHAVGSSEKTASTDITTIKGNIGGNCYITDDDHLPVVIPSASSTYIESQESQKDTQSSQHKTYFSDGPDYPSYTSLTSEPQLEQRYIQAPVHEIPFPPSNYNYSTLICPNDDPSDIKSISNHNRNFYLDTTYPVYTIPHVYNPKIMNTHKIFNPNDVVITPTPSTSFIPMSYITPQDLIKAMPNYYEE